MGKPVWMTVLALWVAALIVAAYARQHPCVRYLRLYVAGTVAIGDACANQKEGAPEGPFKDNTS